MRRVIIIALALGALLGSSASATAAPIRDYGPSHSSAPIRDY